MSVVSDFAIERPHQNLNLIVWDLWFCHPIIITTNTSSDQCVYKYIYSLYPSEVLAYKKYVHSML